MLIKFDGEFDQKPNRSYIFIEMIKAALKKTLNSPWGRIQVHITPARQDLVANYLFLVEVAATKSR